jgi:hypothetical protein
MRRLCATALPRGDQPGYGRDEARRAGSLETEAFPRGSAARVPRRVPEVPHAAVPSRGDVRHDMVREGG